MVLTNQYTLKAIVPIPTSGCAVQLRADKARDRLVDSWWAMRLDLENVLETLRAHERDLRRLGVSHAAVFGSVARGDAGAESDIDVLVDLDENRPMGIFEYARLKLYIDELLDGASDVVNRRTLKPLLRANILYDAIDAF
jgi:predicted nucleotidyltransferase